MSKTRLDTKEKDNKYSSDRHQHKREERRKRRNKVKKIMSGIGWSLLTNFLSIIHMIFDKMLEIILEWYWGDKNVCKSLNEDNKFLSKSAVELALMIRNKKITSYQLVKASYERILETNPNLNFIIDGPFEDALEQAKNIDERIAKGLVSEDEFSEKPFLGVPFSTKDSTACKGKLQTLGIISRRNYLAKEDSECIRLMKESGAILLATTSIPEINRWQETRNNIIGQTNNPYDTRRTVGGSSGGEAVSISSCSTTFGIGTDIGGSIRMPCFYVGLFGHKPTPQLISTKGCTLRNGTEPSTMVVVGPMVRYASDLMPLFKILVGSKNCISLKLDEEVNLKKLRYFYIKESGDIRTSAISSDLKKSMSQVVSHFENISDEPVKEVTLSGTAYTSKLWRYWMTKEPNPTFKNLLGNGKDINVYAEIGKKFIGKSDFTLATIFSLIDSLLPKENSKKMEEITKNLEEEFEELLGDDGILFYHSAPHAAPFHYTALFKIFNFSYWCLLNVLRVPCTQVPLGINSNNVPLGIQIVATKLRDRHCIAVAEEIERAFGGWTKPFQ